MIRWICSVNSTPAAVTGPSALVDDRLLNPCIDSTTTLGKFTETGRGNIKSFVYNFIDRVAVCHIHPFPPTSPTTPITLQSCSRNRQNRDSCLIPGVS
ncbi:hypothetical protein J6590_001680 [Homalodisca vitripennis]|nr:hypothetical protein J6590_001680 [Homalodisca vitripennis]